MTTMNNQGERAASARRGAPQAHARATAAQCDSQPDLVVLWAPQAYYAIPFFRDAILHAPVPADDVPAEADGHAAGSAEAAKAQAARTAVQLVRELQRLFVAMAIGCARARALRAGSERCALTPRVWTRSGRKHVDPSPVMQHLLDASGNPVAVGNQQARSSPAATDPRRPPSPPPTPRPAVPRCRSPSCSPRRRHSTRKTQSTSRGQDRAGLSARAPRRRTCRSSRTSCSRAWKRGWPRCTRARRRPRAGSGPPARRRPVSRRCLRASFCRSSSVSPQRDPTATVPPAGRPPRLWLRRWGVSSRSTRGLAGRGGAGGEGGFSTTRTDTFGELILDISKVRRPATPLPSRARLRAGYREVREQRSENKPLRSENKPLRSENKPLRSENKPLRSENKPLEV